jgi:signal transduction histidine kinase
MTNRKPSKAAGWTGNVLVLAGAGLGLATAKLIAATHGGNIRIDEWR